MIKPKQPLNKIKNAIVRKPSLPIKRTSSALSCASDHSCMSDRIIYKKAALIENPNPSITVNDQRNMLSNTFDNQKSNPINASQRSLKKIKNKLSVGSEVIKKNDQKLTGFQWLIIMRHCYHIQNKRRSSYSIKQRTLVNYIRNKMYPDSLWNKILVMENQVKISSKQIISTIQKQSKWRLTLDDILICIGKNYFLNQNTHTDDHESAAQTARFTQNMKANSEYKSAHISQENHIQPKYISQKVQQKIKNTIQHKIYNKEKVPKQIQQMSISDMNQFRIQSQISISPISINDQTNNVSFSMQENQSSINLHNENKSAEKTTSNNQDRFQSAFNGIQALKQNLQSSNQVIQKMILAKFLQQILCYSIYKNKLNTFPPTNTSKKHVNNTNTLQHSKGQSSLGTTSYFYGLKLQNRKSLQKIPMPILQKLFGSRQFTQYFQNLQAIKISEYFEQLGLTLSVLGSNLRILNLSNNNIRSISLLKEINGQKLQFINLNNNKLANISELLGFERIQQIHAKNNLIDHISSSKVICKKLRIVDLGFNQVSKEEDLWSLANLPTLTMLNLVGNPIIVSFKSIGVLRKQVIVQHTDMYLFSNYTQYRDVSFQAKQKQIKESTNQDALPFYKGIEQYKGHKKI